MNLFLIDSVNINWIQIKIKYHISNQIFVMVSYETSILSNYSSAYNLHFVIGMRSSKLHL